ncbi:AP endonuclease 2 [Balamuthia mandrillaris]
MKSVSRKLVGAHISAQGGVDNIFARATAHGCKAIAFFTRNQRSWKNPPMPSPALVQSFQDNMKKYGFTRESLLPHGNYLVNLGSPNEDAREKSKVCFLDELKRCQALGIPALNIHPGSSLGKISTEECCKRIAECINWAHQQTEGVAVVLENMAGQGHTIGGPFADLKLIIDAVEDKSRVGVCLDTCHLFAAGHDISTPDSYKEVMDQFDSTVGFKYLRGIHINDSKGVLACKRDRHENLGKGTIGLEAFRCLMQDKRMDGIPMVLETPAGSPGIYTEEVKMLYDLEQMEEEEFQKMLEQARKTKPKIAENTKAKGKKGGRRGRTQDKNEEEEDEDDEQDDEDQEKKTKKKATRGGRSKKIAKGKKKAEGSSDEEEWQPKKTSKKRTAGSKRTRQPIDEEEDEEEEKNAKQNNDDDDDDFMEPKKPQRKKRRASITPKTNTKPKNEENEEDEEEEKKTPTTKTRKSKASSSSTTTRRPQRKTNAGK